MRLLIVILLFSFTANGQIVRCNPFYKSSVQVPLFLDLYPSATIAVSFRKLRIAYSGSCIRVRRSIDNSEQDIGFSNNYLDTAAMKTFVGVNNGFVVTWYDQSGSGNNVTQATAASQPIIIVLGIINRQNGIACISTTTGLFLATSGVLFNTFPMSIISAIGSHLTASTDFFGTRNGGGGWIAGYRTGPSQYSFSAISTTGTNLNLSQQSKFISYISRIGSANSLYINSTNSATSTTTYNSSTSLFAIGKGGTGTSTNNANANIFEVIGYASDKGTSRTAMEINLNTFYSIY